MTFKGPDLLELKVGISEELSEKLERIQDLVCSKSGTNASLAETLDVMAEITLGQLDPLRKAERAMERKAKKTKKSENVNGATISGYVGNDSARSVETG